MTFNAGVGGRSLPYSPISEIEFIDLTVAWERAFLRVISHNNCKVFSHYSKKVRHLDGLRTLHVCPAQWKPELAYCTRHCIAMN